MMERQRSRQYGRSRRSLAYPLPSLQKQLRPYRLTMSVISRSVLFLKLISSYQIDKTVYNMASGNKVGSPFLQSIYSIHISLRTSRSQANELRLDHSGPWAYPLAALPRLPHNGEESEFLRRLWWNLVMLAQV